MTNPPTNPPNPAPASSPAASLEAEVQQSLFPIARSWKIASGVAAVMVVLALLGVGLTTTSNAVAPVYWVSLVPVFGLLCLAIAWSRARHEGRPPHTDVFRQVLHWVGIGVALALDFLIRGTGEESGTAAGLNALLLLALGCFLAGIHMEWIFTMVGALLTLTLVVVVKAEQYVWLIFVVGGLSVAAMFALQWLLSREHPHTSAPGAAGR
jgi:hypothetical protein